MERLASGIRKKFGIRYPKPTTDQLNRIIERVKALGHRASDLEWKVIVYEICGSDNLLLTEGQDFSDLNALLSQAITGIDRG